MEPDRSEVVYSAENDPATGTQLAPAWYGGSNEAAVRTFGALHERAWEGSGDWQWMLGRGARAHRLKVGGLFRSLDRDAENRSFSISAPGTLSREQREATPEEIFDGRFTAPGQSLLNITSLSAGGSYAASDRWPRGRAAGVLPHPRPAWWVAARGGALRRHGARHAHLRRPGDGQPGYTDVLPSLALNWAVTDAQNLRLSFSRTLSRPSTARSPQSSTQRARRRGVRGNETLRRTLIDNFDLRWELYPNSGEVLSVALFAKRFDAPIERVYLATSGTPIVTFVNARAARNYGVEVEARRERARCPLLERTTFSPTPR